MNLTTIKTMIDDFKKAFQIAFMNREDELMILLVALVIKRNVAIIGSHGEAKSALVEQFAKNINKKYFGMQFNRFTTPDEAIGHFSLKEMKENDTYKRKTSGKLADCQIAYLDEAFNASGAMLQSLQKLLNEKRVDLGDGTELVAPIEMAVCTTNFHISKQKELAPLWDRFCLRIETPPLLKKINENQFNTFLKTLRSNRLGEVNCIIAPSAIKSLQRGISNCSVSQDIEGILFKLVQFCQANKINVSTRRLIWAVEAIKAMALLDGRRQVQRKDLSILKHVLWEHSEQFSSLSEKIEELSKESCIDDVNKAHEAIRKAIAFYHVCAQEFRDCDIDQIADFKIKLAQAQRDVESILDSTLKNKKFRSSKDEQVKSILAEIALCKEYKSHKVTSC